MKPKMTVRLIADALMTLSLLFLMGYQLWGEVAHEWVGAGMFALFLLHHLLNLNRYKRLLKGKYTPMRIATLSVDVLVFFAMLALMYSGIVMSRHVFSFLPIESGMVLARRVHILGSYWGFLLMSLHLGLHWKMILALTSKQLNLKLSRKGKIIIFLLSAFVAVYGIAAFVRRDFAAYLFLKSEFVFFDYGEPKLLFYLDYLTIMELCIFAAHYALSLMRKVFKK